MKQIIYSTINIVPSLWLTCWLVNETFSRNDWVGVASLVTSIYVLLQAVAIEAVIYRDFS